MSLEELIQQLIDDGKGDAGRLEHILSTIKKDEPLYDSDNEYLEKLLAEIRKSEDTEQGKNELKSEVTTKEEIHSEVPTQEQFTEIEKLRKEIHKLQDKNHAIEEHLKNNNRKKHGTATAIGLSILGTILVTIGLGLTALGTAMISRGSYQSGYGFANDSDSGLVLFLLGIPFVVVGIRMIAHA